MNLTTNVLTHVVVFMDGSTMDITERAFEAITAASVNPDVKHIRLKGQMFALSSISKILTREDYVEQYPEKQTYNYGQPYTDINALEGNTAEGGKGREIVLAALEKRNPELVRTIKKGRLFTEKTYEPKYKKWEEAKAAGVI